MPCAKIIEIGSGLLIIFKIKLMTFFLRHAVYAWTCILGQREFSDFANAKT